MDGNVGMHHDIVVIGGSAGSFSVVRYLLRDLPSDFPAAVLIVIHGTSTRLAEILSAESRLNVVQARSGENVKYGSVYVAAPDRHLMLHQGHLLVRRGPRENLSRPAIDPLFRSAAASLGGRVVGVLLSGALNDGTAGLAAIKRMNGLAVVQDPRSAEYPSMPENALLHVAVDHVVGPGEIAPLLRRLVHQPALPSPDVPIDMRLESAIAVQELKDMETEDRLGTPSRFTCPNAMAHCGRSTTMAGCCDTAAMSATPSPPKPFWTARARKSISCWKT